MFRSTFLALSAVLLCNAVSAAQDDPIKSQLTTAKQDCEKHIASAHEALVQLLKTKEAEVQRAGDLQSLDKVRSEITAFESNGELPKSVQTRTYIEAIKKARKNLEDAYLTARKGYTQAGQIDIARDIDKELQDFKNPSQIDSKTKVEGEDSTSFDLLKLVDPRIDTVRGQWRQKGSSLVSPSPYEEEARLEIPVWPDGDYEVIVKFVRLEGPHGPGLTLPLGFHQVNFVLDGDSGTFSGLQKLDGRFFRDKSNPTRVPGVRLVNNKEYTLMARVTMKGEEPGRIQIELDGNRVIDWTGRPAQVSMDPNWVLRDNRTFGLHAWGTVFRFDSIQLRMLSGDAKRPWMKARQKP